MPLENLMITKEHCLHTLSECGIAHETIQHPIANTTQSHIGSLRGTTLEPLIGRGQTIHLFLQVPSDAGPLADRLILISALLDTPLDLRLLAKRMGLQCELRVVTESDDIWSEVMNLNHFVGCMNPFVMLQAQCSKVTLLLDRGMLGRERVMFHPMRMDFATAITPSELTIFLNSVSPGKFAFVDLTATAALTLPTLDTRRRTAMQILISKF